MDHLLAEGFEVEVLAAGAMDERQREPATHSRLCVHFLGGEELFAPPGALPRLLESPRRLRGLLAATRQVLSHAVSLRKSPPERAVAHWALPSAVPWALLLLPQAVPLEVVFHGSDVQLLCKLPEPVRNLVLSSLKARKCSLRFVSHQLREQLVSACSSASLKDYARAGSIKPAALSLANVPDRQKARAELGIGADVRLALIVGRLLEGKRPRTALRAAELVPSLLVKVIGDGPLKNELEAEFPGSCLPGIEFLGQLGRGATLTWIAAADVILCASRSEGAPTVVREARALNVPVVSVNCGDLPLWQEHDSGLWLID